MENQNQAAPATGEQPAAAPAPEAGGEKKSPLKVIIPIVVAVIVIGVIIWLVV